MDSIKAKLGALGGAATNALDQFQHNSGVKTAARLGSHAVQKAQQLASGPLQAAKAKLHAALQPMPQDPARAEAKQKRADALNDTLDELFPH